jgi:hypothetical protein
MLLVYHWSAVTLSELRKKKHYKYLYSCLVNNQEEFLLGSNRKLAKKYLLKKKLNCVLSSVNGGDLKEIDFNNPLNFSEIVLSRIEPVSYDVISEERFNGVYLWLGSSETA